MIIRYLSLYFASIGPWQAVLALYSALTSISNGAQKRSKLNKLVGEYYGAEQVLAYSTARGSIAAFLRAAGVGTHDTVLISCFTCLAVPCAVLACGAKPIYADINVNTLNIDLENLKKSLRPSTKVIIVQHTMGIAVDAMDEICRFAKDNGILVLEDCALSIGTVANGNVVGSIGDAAVFSMELSKTLSTGWGGILINNNRSLASDIENHYNTIGEEKKLTQIRKILQVTLTGLLYHETIYALGKYLVAAFYKIKLFKGSTPEREILGEPDNDFVARLGGAQANLAIHQFGRFDYIRNINSRNYTHLRNSLKNSGYKVLGKDIEEHFPVSSRVPFLVHEPKTAIEWFSKRGIELGTWFNGDLSPLQIYNFNVKEFPNLQFIAGHIVNLPCHNRITKSDLKWFDETIQMFAAENPYQLNV